MHGPGLRGAGEVSYSVQLSSSEAPLGPDKTPGVGMRAAVMIEPGRPLEVRELTPRALRPTEVHLRIDASGVCRSDETIRRHGMGGLGPVILGHEGAGTVLEVGSQVGDLSPGNRVIGAFQPACGSCWHCVRSRTHHCEQIMHVATQAHWKDDHSGDRTWSMSGLGTFAEEAVVDRMSVVAVNTDLPAEQLALIGCAVMTGVGAALNTARIEPGSVVAVLGCGGVGQFVVQGARIAGASRIVAIDPVLRKREAATANGATDVIDPTTADAIEVVRDMTGGRGADYAFEVALSGPTLRQAYDLCRNAGTVVAVGMPTAGTTVEFDAYQLFSTEKRLLGCYYGSGQVRRDFPRLVALAEAGRLDLAGAVSRRIALDDVNEAFVAMANGGVIRSVIVPSAPVRADLRGGSA
jgi:S-(hydroxymethyl)glutathione dehydrogenase / alcohol dehydrogenase